MDLNYGCHAHRYCGYTSFAENHRHYYNCISTLAQNCRCHIHCLKGITSCDDGHTHTFEFLTGYDIPIWGGRHIHFYCGVTDRAHEHVHYMIGYTLTEQ